MILSGFFSSVSLITEIPIIRKLMPFHTIELFKIGFDLLLKYKKEDHSRKESDKSEKIHIVWGCKKQIKIFQTDSDCVGGVGLYKANQNICPRTRRSSFNENIIGADERLH